MDLNDDCLLAILAELEVNHLADMANVCRRLQTLAGLCFETRHKSTLVLATGRIREITEIEECFLPTLETFGPSATKVVFSTEYTSTTEFTTEVFLMIVKHCPNIVNMDLGYFYINLKGQNKETLTKIRRLMSKVTTLSFNWGLMPDALIKYCYAVETLTLENVYHELDFARRDILNQHLPHLKTVRWNNPPDVVIEGLLEANHKHIKTLQLFSTLRSNRPRDIIAKASQLTDLYLELNISSTSEDLLIGFMSDVAKHPTLKLMSLKLFGGTAIFSRNLFEVMSAVEFLKDIHIHGTESEKEEKEMLTIKLRRSDVIHGFYQYFEPY